MNLPNQGDFKERMRSNWQRRAGEHTTFRAELQIIPRWLFWILLALYIAALVVVVCWGVFSLEGVRAPVVQKVMVLVGIVTAGAIGVSIIVLFCGYIAADAKRRGMTPWLWVLLAILVPYLIGVILYFVVREPLLLNCPQCGRTVNPHFNFCPSCQFNLRPNCPQCRRAIRAGDQFCPYCGFTLQPKDATQAPAPTQ